MTQSVDYYRVDYYRVDYYLTPTSPWTYLGHERFAQIAKRHGAAVAVKPVDYGVIFPQSGGLPLGKQMAIAGDFREQYAGSGCPTGVRRADFRLPRRTVLGPGPARLPRPGAGEITLLGDTRRVAGYLPVQRGGRFSTKARTPSLKSALP